ncbi:MAG: inorganic pyrophosphatase [Nanohaloarchaea archaeon]|nr:inorganic pyrophosphatase [Candidatus Nanohaloarchaea archaeon]
MQIIIETPKYSFFKYDLISPNRYKKVMFSPIPIIFNYGSIVGTRAQDNMPVDVIVLGPRMRQGSIIERDDNKKFDGAVHFIDDSIVDDKMIVYVRGLKSRSVLSLYFRVYALYKIIWNLISKRKITGCRVAGIEFY